MLEDAAIQHESQGMLLISLRPHNVDEYEHKSAVSIVNEIKALEFLTLFNAGEGVVLLHRPRALSYIQCSA